MFATYSWVIRMMLDTTEHYRKMMDDAGSIPKTQLLMGIVFSSLLMVASTYGLLVFLDQLGVLELIDISIGYSAQDIARYAAELTAISFGVAALAGIICIIVIKKPKAVFLPLKIHQFFKRGIGEYFISPDPPSQSWSRVLRRSIYGSILVTGIGLTIIGFDMVQSGIELVGFGGQVMLISTVILPFTLMQFYYGPWLLKDSGLFHLDKKDRSLSNVGDDLEDILEFVAGLDLILVVIEITLNTDIWVAIFILLVFLGPLFAVVLNFTIVLMFVRNDSVASMISLLIREYDVPDMIGSGDYIRYSIATLVEKVIVVDNKTSTVGLGIHPSPIHDSDDKDYGPEESGDSSQEGLGPNPEIDNDEND